MDSKLHTDINSTKEFLEVIKAGKTVWPGGYEITFITNDGRYLHFDCVKENLMDECRNIRDKYDSHIIGVFTNWEDEDLCCEWCDEKINTEYEDC
jgi:3-phosphoglycerate kinase